jgi:hypothetical protein
MIAVSVTLPRHAQQHNHVSSRAACCFGAMFLRFYAHTNRNQALDKPDRVRLVISCLAKSSPQLKSPIK